MDHPGFYVMRKDRGPFTLIVRLLVFSQYNSRFVTKQFSYSRVLPKRMFFVNCSIPADNPHADNASLSFLQLVCCSSHRHRLTWPDGQMGEHGAVWYRHNCGTPLINIVFLQIKAVCRYSRRTRK